uniref:Peptidase A1 domain-containing protein n=1 Tax=Leersia perrieri TaxID=77586 RepID=A0A0D9VA10_9ORYZ
MSITMILSVLLLLPRYTSANDAGNGGKPLVTAVTKDDATKLYTISVTDDGRPLAVDLSGQLVWSTCAAASHPTVILPYERECIDANRLTPPRCWSHFAAAATGGDAGYSYGNKCTARPYNGVSGACAAGDLTRTTLAADSTDGSNPLYRVAFPAVAACAPSSLLASLPSSAAGVAGLGRGSSLALHSQVAATQRVSRKFALCLPSVAVFGGGPFVLIFPYNRPDITASLSYTALRRKPEIGGEGGYYITAKGITVNQQRLPLTSNLGGDSLVVQLSTTVAYTELRHDVYGVFLKAWNDVVAWPKKVARPASVSSPFEVCYESRTLSSNRLGYAVPDIEIELEDGATWYIFGGNSLVQVDDNTVCFAFVEMKQKEAEWVGYGGDSPAVVIGGYQMEHNLVLLLVSLSPSPIATATNPHHSPSKSKPIVTRLGKDPATSLYTISISGNGAAPLVVDLAGALLWSTTACSSSSPHRTIPRTSSVCTIANRNHPPGCPYAGGGGGERNRCACAAYPYNPVSGRCERGDVTALPLAANATDGENPLFPVSFTTFGPCAPPSLAASLPAGTPGQLAAGLRENPVPLIKSPKNGGGGGYYLRVTDIAVNLKSIPIPPKSLDLDARRGVGGVTLSTVTPYTALRTDIYRSLLNAFDAATSGIPRAPAPAPARHFEMCYEASALSTTRLGFAVANIDLVLDGGRSGNWTFPGGSSLVQVDERTVCFAFVEIGGSMSPPATVAGSPAVVIGGFQMENNLLLFDLEKGTLGISSLLYKITLLLSLLAAPLLFSLAAGAGNGEQSPPSRPILTRLAKDPATNLYTAAVNNGAGGQMVLDLAGPLIWTTKCPPQHRNIPCHAGVCAVANRNHRENCPYTAVTGNSGDHCACSATAYNPANGQCGYGDLTTAHLSANATDGKNPLYPVTFAAVASCAPPQLLRSLPSAAAGVAGFSRALLSLPTQVAGRLKVEKKFAICLPATGEDGAAIIGGGPFWLQAAPPQQVSDRLRYTPLLKNPRNSAYYIGVTGVAVNGAAVPLPPGALSLSARRGTGGVALSTATPYTALRTDIYRPLRDAFAAATASVPRAASPAPAPFEICYQKSALPSTRIGPYTASVDLMLAGGENFTVVGASAVVDVGQDAVCFAFVEMGNASPAVDQSPAVIIGGHQMEDNLVVFDLEKWQFGYSGLLLGTMTRCGNFDFSMGSH